MWGQSLVSGVVKDSETGQVLVGATVVLCDHVTYTDTEGKFSINVHSDACLMTVTYIGYIDFRDKISLPFNEDESFIAFLSPSENILDQTVITASRYVQKKSNSDVSLELLSPKEIERTNKISIDQVLDLIPGVDVIDGQANIRGGSGYSYGAGSRVLLVEDGLSALQFDGGFPNWEDIPTELVSRVEVLKGASSVLYGSSALNGVIHVKTQDAPAEPTTKFSTFYRYYGGPEEEIRQWWDSINPYEFNTSLYHGRKFGKLDFQISGNYNSLQSYNQTVESEKIRGRVSLKYYFTDRMSLSLNTQYNYSDKSNFFYWGNALRKSFQPSENVTSEQLNKRFKIDPTFVFYDGNDNKHVIRARYYHVNNASSNEQGIKSVLGLLNYQYTHKLESIHANLISGFDFNVNQTNAELYGGNQYNALNAAVYSQWSQELLSSKLRYTLGVRYEYYRLQNPDFTYEVKDEFIRITAKNDVEYKPVFRVGLNYQPFIGTFLRTSWGQGYRFPTIAEKFTSTSFGGFNIIPNPALQSETGWSAEIGLRQEFKWNALMGYADVAFFNSDYSNMMEFGLTPEFLGAFKAQNIGDTRINGFETGVGAQWGIGALVIRGMAAYTYINPKYKEFTEQIQNNSTANYNILKYRSRHSFKSQLSIGLFNWEFWMSQRYNSHMESIDQVFNDFIPGIENFRSIYNKGFNVLAYNLTYSFKNIRIGVNIDNAFNVLYTERPGLLEAPRNYSLNLNAKF